MNTKRGVVLGVFLLLLCVATVNAAEYGDNSWLDIKFSGFGGVLTDQDGDANNVPSWNLKLPQEDFVATFLDSSVINAVTYEGYNSVEDGQPLNVGTPQATDLPIIDPEDIVSSVGTDFFFTWIYIDLAVRETFVEGVSNKVLPELLFTPPQHFRAYSFTCGEDLGSCDGTLENLQVGSSTARVNLKLKPGWNAILFTGAASNFQRSQLTYQSTSPKLSEIDYIQFMGSDYTQADEDRDDVLDWEDVCLGTPFGEEVSHEEGREGCSQSQKDPDEDAELCRDLNGHFTPGVGCCGDDGLADLGLSVINGDGVDYLCVSKESELTGHSETPTVLEKLNNLCAGLEWCWLGSPDSTAEIYTIKSPGTVPYDVVSDGERWQECVVSGPLDTSDLISTDSDAFTRISDANRFYCYFGDGSWNWAECVPEGEQANNPGKERAIGETAYAITNLVHQGFRVISSFDAAENYDGDNLFDFESRGYGRLQFFVRFNEAIHYPTNINVRIEGSQNVGGRPVYLDQKNVLGSDILNQVTTETQLNQWLPVSIRVPDLAQSNVLVIESSNPLNSIEVRDVSFLMNREPSAYCSGNSEIPGVSSWLTFLDSSSTLSPSLACNARYSPNDQSAWLPELSQCCSYQDNQYFVAESSSCFAGVPVRPGETFSPIGVLVEYSGRNVADQLEREFYQPFVYFLDEAVFATGGFPSQSISPLLSPKKIVDNFSVAKYVGERTEFTLIGDSGNDNVEILFSTFDDPSELRRELTQDDIVNNQTKVNIFAQLTSSPGTFSQESVRLQSTKQFICHSEECIFPLPGEPPYTVTIAEPELYDAYFVISDDISNNIPIGESATINQPANLLIKNAPKQLVYDNSSQQFAGCFASDLVTSRIPDVLFSNELSCSVRAGNFCSPSTITSNNDLTLASWSNEQLDQVGYLDESFASLGSEQDFSSFTGAQLREATETEKLLPRNHTAMAPPGRNLVPNAELHLDRISQQLPYWNILDVGVQDYTDLTTFVDLSGTIVENLQEFLVSHEQNNGVYLNDLTKILVSSPIAVPEGKRLEITNNGSASLIFLPYSQTGELLVTSPRTIPPEETAYLVLVFIGPGEVYQPHIEIVDAETGAAGYSPIVEENKQNNDARAGLACCPQNWCWNGYACVAPMDDIPNAAEVTGEAQLYRCIEGDWEYQAPKYDWNGNNWGFCAAEEQCFVQLATPEGQRIAQPTEAGDSRDLQISFPTCLDSGEYRFDHLCQAGTWETRTQELAKVMLDIPRNRDDFTFFCTSPGEAFPTLDATAKDAIGIREKSLSGEVAEEESATTFGQPYDYSCFTNLPKTLFGENATKHPENTCINNVCVLQLEDQVIFGTTLNEPLTDLNGFMSEAFSLIPTCSTEGGFTECTTPADGTVWYDAEHQAIVLSESEFELSERRRDDFTDYFAHLFPGQLLVNQTGFLSTGQNYNNLYLRKTDDKIVAAAMERRWSIEPSEEARIKEQSIIAEFYDFETPICDFVDDRRIDQPLELEALQEVSGQQRIACAVKDSIQRVEAVAPLDFLWPQITGMLR